MLGVVTTYRRGETSPYRPCSQVAGTLLPLRPTPSNPSIYRYNKNHLAHGSILYRERNCKLMSEIMFSREPSPGRQTYVLILPLVFEDSHSVLKLVILLLVHDRPACEPLSPQNKLITLPKTRPVPARQPSLTSHSGT